MVQRQGPLTCHPVLSLLDGERQIPHDFVYMWNSHKINEQTKWKQILR